ncbi:MAG: hypothetical protein HQK79_20050 [Desulfobacterales bacterium]|nr:hypothetical protein [Desulfobacterales bacterium]MBF0398102.1 hypothetical protein [Desulfobacterales bacterium]
MLIRKVLPIIGKADFFLYKFTSIGESLIRFRCRVLATLIYHIPLFGGKLCSNSVELKSEWINFLNRFGIVPMIISENENEFQWHLDNCPYNFQITDEKGVCDACMDLDRTFIKLLGGELDILETIPGGSNKCKFIVKLSHMNNNQKI